jgi:hypothetical protein
MPNIGGFKKVNFSPGYNVTVILLGFLHREGIVSCSSELLGKMCKKTPRSYIRVTQEE